MLYFPIVTFPPTKVQHRLFPKERQHQKAQSRIRLSPFLGRQVGNVLTMAFSKNISGFAPLLATVIPLLCAFSATDFLFITILHFMTLEPSTLI